MLSCLIGPAKHNQAYTQQIMIQTVGLTILKANNMGVSCFFLRGLHAVKEFIFNMLSSVALYVKPWILGIFIKYKKNNRLATLVQGLGIREEELQLPSSSD